MRGFLKYFVKSVPRCHRIGCHRVLAPVAGIYQYKGKGYCCNTCLEHDRMIRAAGMQ